MHLLKLLKIVCFIEQDLKSEKMLVVYSTYSENGDIVISQLSTDMQTQYLIYFEVIQPLPSQHVVMLVVNFLVAETNVSLNKQCNCYCASHYKQGK